MMVVQRGLFLFSLSSLLFYFFKSNEYCCFLFLIIQFFGRLFHFLCLFVYFVVSVDGEFFIDHQPQHLTILYHTPHLLIVIQKRMLYIVAIVDSHHVKKSTHPISCLLLFLIISKQTIFYTTQITMLNAPIDITGRTL